MNNFLKKMNNFIADNNKTISHMAKKIIAIIKTDKNIETSKQLANECDVSLSMVSKFCKKIGYKNVNEILFLIRLAQQDLNSVVKNTDKKTYTSLMNKIIRARKILFVGRGNANIINCDFKAKLDRLGIWSQTTNSKYEEVGLSRICDERDLIIINSVTMQHEYLQTIIKNSFSNIVVITTAELMVDKPNVEVIKYNTNSRELRFDRVFSIDSRNAIQNIFDSVFEEMLKIPGNLELLKLTSYK